MRSGVYGWAVGGVAVLAVILGGGLYLTLTPDGPEYAPVTGPARQGPSTSFATGGGSQFPLPPPKPTAATPPAQVPQPVAEAYGGWRVQCQLDVQSRESCRAEHVVKGQDGQPQLAVIAYPAAGATPARIRIMPPWGVLIAAGVAVRVDALPALQVPITSCLVTGCQADLTLSDGLLQAMRAGTAMQVGMISSDGKAVATSMPLTGFSEAYSRISEKPLK